MYKVHCLNNISPVGLALLDDEFELTDTIDDADAILVRSANMHEMELPDTLKCVARAGAGVNNIPLEALAERTKMASASSRDSVSSKSSSIRARPTGEMLLRQWILYMAGDSFLVFR